MEIVTEPELNSPQEAFDFLEKLKSIIRYLEVSDCNMEECSLRCDANVSIRPEGTEEYGVKTEVKNMNSFKGVRNALSYEIDRQKQVLNKFGRIVQETRLWDETKKITMPMRSKEEAHDYRYFPEPDLVYFNIDKDKIAQVGQLIPELPEEKKERFKNDYNLPEYDAGVLTAEKDISDFFDECCSYYDDYKLISNWFMGQVMETLNENKITISKLNVSPENLSGLIRLLGENKINVSTAKNVFEKMIKTNKTALNIVQEENLTQISDGSELKKFAHQVIEENQKSADDFKSGKKQALMYLVGQVMRKTKGKADAKIVKDILETMLK